MAVVQAFASGASGFNASFTTTAVTFTAGNFIVVWISVVGGQGVIGTVKSSQNDGMTLLQSPLGMPPPPASASFLNLYVIPSCQGGSTTFTVPTPNFANVSVTGVELSGRLPTLAAISNKGLGTYNTVLTTTHVGDTTSGSVVAGDDVVWASATAFGIGTDIFSSIVWNLPLAGQVSGTGGNSSPQVTGYLENVSAGSYQVSYTSSVSSFDGSIILGIHNPTYNNFPVAWLN